VAVYDQTEAAHGGLSVVERTRRIVHEPCSIKAHTFGYTRSILFESLRSLPRPASFQIIYVSGYKRKMNIGRQREPAVGAHIFDMLGGESDTACKWHERALQQLTTSQQEVPDRSDCALWLWSPPLPSLQANPL
jgi:hypothetical protein